MSYGAPFQRLATNTFDNVSIGSLTPLAGTWLQPTMTVLGGDVEKPSGFQALGGFAYRRYRRRPIFQVLGSQLYTASRHLDNLGHGNENDGKCLFSPRRL